VSVALTSLLALMALGHKLRRLSYETFMR